VRRGTVKVPGVDNAGAGKPGYCKLCSLRDGLIQNQFDERTREGWTPKQLNVWISSKVENWQAVDRETVYKHRDHVKHPQDRIVNAVQRAEQRALQTVPQSSPDAFLDALVSLGHQKAIDNPEEVTIDHALRAASTLKQSKDNSKGGLNVLIALITGNAARPVEIEGDYQDIT
jgi:hypothetical protein